jgi:hexosaminidase
LHANIAYPGMEIRYTEDGTEPTLDSRLYQKPIRASQQVKLKSFDSRGRGSRTVTVKSPEASQ